MILAVALVPIGVALAGGTLLLREIGSSTGTLGPWEEVARSGRQLIDAATAAAPGDSTVAGAARRHGEALSASVRQSRLYTVVTARIVTLLPLGALLGSIILAALAAWAAGGLSRWVSRPIAELVDWTGRIARREPLPPEPGGGAGVTEFDALRGALRGMARELEEARRQELESARLRAWTEMARRVAHELKNPLTPMRMSASALARSDDTRVRETAEMLLEEVSRLEEMARTFAQFGRLPEGPTAPVDLVELLEALAERHDGKPVPVRLLVPAPLPMVSGHHELLSRVFRNLVVNAQEAASEGGGTAVEVRVEARDGHVRVTVSDDGPGIPPELLERIWLPDVTTKRKGTGLGLPMVRQAVTAHGGRVEASNRPGGGAEFVVTLPVEPTEPAPAAHTPVDERV